MKTCAKCQIEKQEEAFNRSINRKDGLNPYCKTCCKQYREENKEALRLKKKEYYYENQDLLKSKNREKYERSKNQYRESQVKYYSEPNNWVKRMLCKAKERANKAGLEYSISSEDLSNIPTHCPYLGIELTFELGKGQLPSNASLDRIDSTKGYIPGNVQIISRRANTMKNDASSEELLNFSLNVLKMKGIVIVS